LRILRWLRRRAATPRADVDSIKARLAKKAAKAE
jgi:hypothetical protein